MTIEGIDPYSPVVQPPVPPPVVENPAPAESEVITEEGTGQNVDTSA